MKSLKKAAVSAILVASMSVGTVGLSDLMTVNASATSAKNLQVTKPAYIELKSGEAGIAEFEFSGEGIGAIDYWADDNLTMTLTGIDWQPYPNDCSATFSITSNDGNGGKVYFALLDYDYQNQFTIATTVKVEGYENAEISFTNMYFPEQIEYGQGCHLNGEITSTKSIYSVTASVFDDSNNLVLTSTQYPNAKSYYLNSSSLDWDIAFSKLGVGKYHLTYTVWSDSVSNNYTHDFKVISTAAAAPVIEFSDMYFPSSIDEGNGQHISGQITSTGTIDAISAKVYDANNNIVMTANDFTKVNTYNLYGSELDWSLPFSSLSAGDYSLYYYVTSGSTQEQYGLTFSVVGKQKPAPVISFNDIYFPSSFEEGTDPELCGDITSTSNVDSVTIEVFDQYGNTALNICYATVRGKVTLNNSNFDAILDFSKLSVGDYTMKYSATSGISSNSYTTYFTVTSKAQPAPEISFTDMYFPPSINQGNGQHIKGTISSTENIDVIQAVVYDSNNRAQISAKRSINKKSYSLYDSGIDWDLSFSKLPAGEYTLCYYVASGTADNSYTHSFTVKEKVSSIPTIKFTNMYFPTSINQGGGQHIKGTITSTDNIDVIQAVVYDSNNRAQISAKRSINQTSYSLYNSDIDWDLSFSKLPAGEYTLCYYVASGTADNSYTHSFTVKGKSSSESTVKFSNMYFPENILVGYGQPIKGKISSSAKIDKITASIKNSSGKTVKTKTVSPGKSSYTLYNSAIDKALTFGELTAGDYTLTYKVTSGKVTKSYTHKFTVTKKEDIKLNLKKGFAYCDKWWNKRNSDWPNTGSDCSNFAAQFLHAAGLPLDNQFKPGTRTVKGFDNLKKYLYKNYNVQTIMRKKYDCLAVEEGFAKIKSNLSAKDIVPGDLIVMQGKDTSGKWIDDGHIMIVYKVSGNKIYCYGHSNYANGKEKYVNASYVQGVVKTSALFG